MTMRINGEHRPSGKEGSVHVDTCWSDTFDKGGAERFLVASAGDYTSLLLARITSPSPRKQAL